MSEDQSEEVVIFVPEVSSSVIINILDLIYKGRMHITPTSTWAIRSLVQILRINAADVSVISGAKKPFVAPIATMANNNQPVNSKPARKRKQEAIEPVQQSNSKVAKVVPPGGRKKAKRGRPPAHHTITEPQEDLDTSTGFHDLEDVETWVCAICQCYDPVLTSPIKNPQQELLMTTEWIGCDCNRWYHKYCTKLKHIDDSFSCKQLKRDCLPLS